MLKADDPFRRDVRQVSLIREVPFILDICRQASGMGFTAVARVTEDRWITCASLDHLQFGLLPGDELDVASTLCQEVRACQAKIVIPDVDASETYRDHRTPARYGFKSYISVPIRRSDGSFWGTLCAIDPAPHPLDDGTVALFDQFARLIGLELDLLEVATSERDAAHLREEFMAMVGHDLRNPLTSLIIGLRLLEPEPLSERGRMLLTEMSRSALRMEIILRDLRDLAQGRLGHGLAIQLADPQSIEPVIRGIVEETRLIAQQPIEVEIDLPRPLRCDPGRLGQCLANLLGNAASHGSPDRPIRVAARDGQDELRIEVTNSGAPIPEALVATIFEPFARGSQAATHDGLGLGLYIAAEIARAHQGRIDVRSTEAATVFTLVMPAVAG